MNKVRKAVIPAAGFGTRMLPMTKTISKEMLPMVDRPIIQVVVEQLVEAGVEDIIIVTAAHKTDIVEYFGDTNPALVSKLRASGPDKEKLVQELESVKDLASFAFIEQRGVEGTGAPVLCAEPYLGDEPFIYAYPDNFFICPENGFRQMMNVYERHGVPVLGCLDCRKDDDYDRYGYVGGEQLAPGLIDMKQIIEKPGKDNAPSNLAWLGFSIVTPDVIQYLHRELAQLPAGRELFFPYAFNQMIADGRHVMAMEIVGADYYDTGDRLEYMKTVVAMAARHEVIGADFRRYLEEFTRSMHERNRNS